MATSPPTNSNSSDVLATLLASSLGLAPLASTKSFENNWVDGAPAAKLLVLYAPVSSSKHLTARNGRFFSPEVPARILASYKQAKDRIMELQSKKKSSSFGNWADEWDEFNLDEKCSSSSGSFDPSRELLRCKGALPGLVHSTDYLESLVRACATLAG